MIACSLGCWGGGEIKPSTMSQIDSLACIYSTVVLRLRSHSDEELIVSQW